MTVNRKALEVSAVTVLEYCVGERWELDDKEHLAALVGLVALGQAAHAAQIIRNLQPAAPAIRHADLVQDAVKRLSLSERTPSQVEGTRWIRDGLIFEVIAWIAAQQKATERTLLRDPHLSSTTQGLDGLMLELEEYAPEIARATIFEDKCTGSPRVVFRGRVLPYFLNLHRGQRASELVAAAASLLATLGLDGTGQSKAAGRVLNISFRAYRSSFAVPASDDSEALRATLFSDYDELEDVTAAQRIAATFLTPDDLRTWFDEFAQLAVEFVNNTCEEGANV